MTAPVLTPMAVRPLPVALPPQPGETLRSWMDRLAADLQVPLGLVLARVGIKPEDSHDHVPAGYGFALTSSAAASVAYATGQPPEAVAATLLSAWDGIAADLSVVDPSRPDTFRAAAAREWVYATGSHCCPACLSASGGVWRLSWRLPWSFACTRHAALLVDTCPGCGQRPQDARRDGRGGPAFSSHIPVPGTCDNPAPAGMGRLGRAGQPCGSDLGAADAAWLDAPAVVSAQERLDAVLALGRADITGTSLTAASYLSDLRALVTVLLSHGDADDLQALLGSRPTRRTPAWAPETLAHAWQVHADARQERADRRASLQAVGVDARRGPRARLFEAAPESAALMALLCIAATPALDAGTADALTPFAAAARRGNHAGLVVLLKARRASDRLLALADQAVRTSGRFVAAGGMEHDADRPGHALAVAHVPALLWPTSGPRSRRCSRAPAPAPIPPADSSRPPW